MRKATGPSAVKIQKNETRKMEDAGLGNGEQRGERTEIKRADRVTFILPLLTIQIDKDAARMQMNT